MSSTYISLEKAEEWQKKLLKAYKQFYKNIPDLLELEMTKSKSDNRFFDKINEDSKTYTENKIVLSVSWLYNLLFLKDKEKRNFNKNYIDAFNELIEFYNSHIFKDDNSLNHKENINTAQNEKEHDGITREIDNKDEFALIFEYVAILNAFDLKMPLTLIQKLCPKRWDSFRLDVIKKNNETGIIKTGDSIHGEFFLELDEKGKRRVDTTELNDELVFKILEYCDLKTKSELYLFERLTLKQRYFTSLFRKFSYDIGDLIHSKKFQSPEKQILLYRLLGFQYFELEDYEAMRKSFAKCQKCEGNNSPGFCIDWAICEKKIGNHERAIEIFEQILKDFPFPQNKNKATRFYLAIYYFKNNDIPKAVSLFSIDDYSLINRLVFWEKLQAFITQLIRDGYSHDATILQIVITELVRQLKIDGKHELSIYVLEQVNSRIKNNDKFKIDLIKSYFKTDKSKAIELIKDLEQTNISKVELACLYIDYYISIKSIDLAILHAKDFIEANSELNTTKVYLKLGEIYCTKRNPDWKTAKFYFEKSESYNLNTNYHYAIALYKLGNGSKAIKIFQKYFNENKNSINTVAISNYITCCIRNNEQILARKLIFSKISNIKTAEYSNYFISFLYQQQLRLTVNYELSEMILDSAIEYADSDNQKAIIYSNYAKYLMNNSEFDTREAINYFKKSNSLKYDSWVVLEIAKCYFFLSDFDLCIDTLKGIDDSRIQTRVNLWKVRSLAKLKKFKTILELLPTFTYKRVKCYSYTYLAENANFTKEERIDYYKKSIEYSYGYYNKLQYSIYLYSIKQREESKRILLEIKNSTQDAENRIEIQNKYNEQISIYSGEIDPGIINRIENNLPKLKKWNSPLINEINSLIKEHPLNDKLYSYKFEYFYKIENYDECDKLLNSLIKGDRINNNTSELFYKLSHNYYTYSNLYSYIGNITQEHQKAVLIKALYYMEYILKIKKSIKFIKLYSIISYKQGDFKKHNKIVKSYSNILNENDKIKLNNYLNQERKKIKIFLWPDNFSEYSNRAYFYKIQVNVASTMIGVDNQETKIIGVKILKSITTDTDFNKENRFNLLREISTRLAHYYYYYEENYGKAFRYQKKVYTTKTYDEPFVGSFLKTIAKLEEFDFGIKICKFYLKNNKTPLILRFYGNFLKEKGFFQESYNSYVNALKLERDNHKKAVLYNNILLLCHTSIVKSKPFKNVNEVIQISRESFQKAKTLDPFFKHLDKTLEKLKEIEQINFVEP